MLKSCTSGCWRHNSSKHHTLLHIYSTPTDNLVVLSMITSPAQTVLISSNDTQSTKTSASPTSILLTTAVVMVKNCFGTFAPCRVILDSATQLNITTNQFTNFLNLKCKRTFASISGIGDGNIPINKSVDILIKSKNGNYVTSLTAMVTASISDYQPSIICNTSEWKIPKNLDLADPSFDNILIGAKLFFELMAVG